MTKPAALFLTWLFPGLGHFLLGFRRRAFLYAGVILAAVLLTLLPEFLRGFAEYRMILYSLLIIMLMILRPQGLFAFRRQRN